MQDVIPVFHFDTAGLPAGSELEAWASILPWFDVGRSGEAGGFNVLASAWLLDGMVLSVTRMPPVWLERSAALIAADGRIDYCAVVGNAPWSFQLDGRPPTRVEPNEVCVLDNSRWFRVETTGGEYVILNLPRPMLAATLKEAVHGALFGSTLAMVFGDFMTGLRSRLPTLTHAQSPAVARALRDLLVACLVAGAEAYPSKGGDTVLQRAGRFIDNHLAEALTVSEVARAMGVSRSRLYRIFAEAGGVERFIVRRRLSRARALLTRGTGRRPGVAEVALATGFASATHFSRVFKAEYGITPAAARSLQSPQPLPPAASENVDRFKSWFAPSS
jgi:AraC-like DNA-binding protein